jgi:hypothetical protein
VQKAGRVPPLREHSPCLSDEGGVGDFERAKRPWLWDAERIHDELYQIGRVGAGGGRVHSGRAVGQPGDRSSTTTHVGQRVLELDHFAQRGEHRRETPCTQRSQTLSPAVAIHGATLVERHTSRLATELTRRTKG